MEDYSKYVCIKKCDSDKCDLLFVDFKYGEISSGGPNIFSKTTKLTQTKKNVKKMLVEKIVELSNKNFESLGEDLKEKYIFKGDDLRKLYATINSGNSIIAVRGYIGPATNVLISKKNYEKYHLNSVFDTPRYNILFDNSVEDIYIYRRNSIEQPGLILAYFENKYELIDIGYFPEKHFLKIVLNNQIK